jgi:ethanolamine utilization protein EutN
MLLADVMGTVTAPEQVASLRSHRLLVVRPIDLDRDDTATPAVAVDTVGAGPGDRVLVATGSAARQLPETRATATDMAIVAIVDSIDLREIDEIRATTTTRSR